MLIILAENKYEEYIKFRNNRRNDNRPSDFCKQILKYPNVKKKNFFKSYFSNVDDLINVIKEYRRISRIPDGEYSLSDLLK